MPVDKSNPSAAVNLHAGRWSCRLLWKCIKLVGVPCTSKYYFLGSCSTLGMWKLRNGYMFVLNPIILEDCLSNLHSSLNKLSEPRIYLAILFHMTDRILILKQHKRFFLIKNISFISIFLKKYLVTLWKSCLSSLDSILVTTCNNCISLYGAASLLHEEKSSQSCSEHDGRLEVTRGD